MSYKPVATRHETQQAYNARRVRELAAAHVHDDRPVKPLTFIETPCGIVMLDGSDTVARRREMAKLEDNMNWGD